jgi:hypothetical protein
MSTLKTRLTTGLVLKHPYRTIPDLCETCFNSDDPKKRGAY